LSSLEPEPFERGYLPPSTYDSPSELPRAVPAPEPPRDRVWLHILLLLLTLVTTTFVGILMYSGFVGAAQLGQRRSPLSPGAAVLGGLWYSIPALTILGAHEMGHYLACRYYGINASLPYFIPFPFSLFGTFGAVIRIREPLRTKRMLFDVGVAGPIAGFIFAVPATVVGMMMSRLVRLPPHSGGTELGEPLLFKLVERLWFGDIPKGVDINSHPLLLAAWFGLFATALNLIPIGQLDGGHIAYANLGRRANYVTYVMLAIMLTLGLTVSANWLVWSGLMLVLLSLFGWQHPRTSDESDSLGTARLLVTLFAILMFILCFTPVPLTQLVGR
jgi:membrane-associated protease RseP (regulator of RpoE activity)